MYTETITLFNRHHSRRGDMWYPHILNNVDLIVDKASILQKYGAETKEKARLHIKYKIDNEDKCIMINKIPYLNLKEWLKIEDDEKPNYVTFNADATYFDFFILGEYENTYPIEDSKDADRSLIDILSDDYEVYVLSSVSSPYKVIPHFEILAR